MNWEAIGAIGEIAGAIGVIATLLYLSVQVRSSTLASRVESNLAATRMYTDFLSGLIHSPEINDLFLRGRKGLSSLTSDEFYRFSNLAVIQFWLRGEGCRQWWVKVGMHMYGNEFVTFVESEIQSIDSARGETSIEARVQPDTVTS